VYGWWIVVFYGEDNPAKKAELPIEEKGSTPAGLMRLTIGDKE